MSGSVSFNTVVRLTFTAPVWKGTAELLIEVSSGGCSGIGLGIRSEPTSSRAWHRYAMLPVHRFEIDGYLFSGKRRLDESAQDGE